MRIYLSFLFVLLSLGLSADTFDFNQRCKDAYTDIVSLRLNDGIAKLEQEKAENPDNLIPYYLDNYVDFLTVFTQEDPLMFEARKDLRDDRIKKLEKGDKSSPYYLFTQAEVYLQWAFARIKFQEYFGAVMDIRRAYKLLEANSAKYPDFIANKKSLGLLHALLGAIPPKYKWGISLFGMSGELEQGMSEIQEVVNYSQKHDLVYRDEAIIILASLKLHLENKPSRAWDILQNAGFPIHGHMMTVYACANIALYSGRSDSTIRILEKNPMQKGYASFPYMEYLLGVAKLNKLDQSAATHFQNFISSTKGKDNIKACYQKLAWLELIQGNKEAYDKYMDNLLDAGQTVLDADKQAQKEAESGVSPHPLLLKARLLSDGGFYNDALALMNSANAMEFSSIRNILEYTYRLGRINDELGNSEDAANAYLKTIENGVDTPWYFAANSALHLAFIYEEEERYELAAKFYQLSLDMKDHEYERGIEQKAKAGLNRVKDK